MRIRHSMTDADDWQYQLAGQLLGTRWVTEDGKKIIIENVEQRESKQNGYSSTYPEVKLGRSLDFCFPVNDFLYRIDPSDIGHIKPRGEVAENIVFKQTESGWRKH